MCGRYSFIPNDNPEVTRIYELAKKEPPTGEIFPGMAPATVIASDQAVKVVTMKWGFPGFKNNQLIINARSESVLQKPMFAEAFTKNRCVFPTTGFFEWNKKHQKFLFNYNDPRETLYIAGFYEYFGQTPQSIILTTEPNDSVREVHSRMPLILAKKQIKAWITNLDFAIKMLHESMPELKCRN